jgi:hypothetical protein
MYWRIGLCCALGILGAVALNFNPFEPPSAGAGDSEGLAASQRQDPPSDPGPPDKFYMAVYAYQTVPNKPRFSHVFAAFVKAGDRQETAPNFEAHTISWLPRSLNILILRRASEPGVNLDLHQTIELGLGHGARVSQWGPFQIKEELYERALVQIKRLNSGAIGYKALDRDVRPDVASNCIHAVSDLDMDQGMLMTGLDRGDAAAAAVVGHLRRWIVDPETTHAWVSERLLPDGKYPIIQR